MEICARSYLTAGMSLTAATAIVLAPLPVPTPTISLESPSIATTAVELTVSPADVAAALAGIPVQLLISGVVDNITTALDVGFSTAIAVTDNPTLVESLTILKTLSVDAYEKLAENLGLINGVITSTTAEAGELMTAAIAGSLENLWVALLNVISSPLDPSAYVDVFDAGITSVQLIATNGLRAVQAIGDGGFEIVDIARQEVTFQFNNATTRLGDLLTQLAEATGEPVIERSAALVRDVGIGSAQTVFNFGSESLGTAIAVANAGFDEVIEGAAEIVDPVINSETVVKSEVTANSDVAVSDTPADDADASARGSAPVTLTSFADEDEDETTIEDDAAEDNATDEDVTRDDITDEERVSEPVTQDDEDDSAEVDRADDQPNMEDQPENDDTADNTE